MTRLPDWEPRLSAYLAGVRSLPYAYGEHDCMLFTMGAVEALTGMDPAAGWRGRYTTEKGAMRTLRKAGYAGIGEALAATFGDPVAPAMAQRGDIVVEGGVPGICMGGFGVFVGQQGDGAGLVRIARADWDAAYRV